MIHRPPRIALAGIAQQTAGNSVRLSVHAESATRVDLLRVYAEGRPVAEAKVCAATGDRTIDVPLLAGHNRLSVVAVDDRGYTSNVAAADVTTTNATARRPDIWVIAIGVDKYPHLDARWQLGAAVADARAVADAFAKQASFAKAHVRTLLDDQVTAASVGRALDELAGMQPDDVAIVFLAGHGMKTRDDAPMVFVTGAVTEKTIEAGGIAWTQISDRLARARGRVVVLLDACHAGHVSQDLVVPNGALASSLQKHGRSGVLVFAAAKGRQLSYETRGPRALARVAIERKPVIARQGDHGVFTAAMLGALADPLTDRDRDGTIQLGELVESVIETVGTLPNGEQTPWVARRELFGDFGIAVAPR